MACTIAYNNKNYTREEFNAFLRGGGNAELFAAFQARIATPQAKVGAEPREIAVERTEEGDTMAMATPRKLPRHRRSSSRSVTRLLG